MRHARIAPCSLVVVWTTKSDHAFSIFGDEIVTAELLVLDTAFFDVVIWVSPFL